MISGYKSKMLWLLHFVPSTKESLMRLVVPGTSWMIQEKCLPKIHLQFHHFPDQKIQRQLKLLAHMDCYPLFQGQALNGSFGTVKLREWSGG